MKNEINKSIRRSKFKGRPCFRWISIGTNGQPVVRRVFSDTPCTVNRWGYPEGENGPYEQVKV